MNINFDTNPGFSAYVLLLMFSGLAMLVVGSPVVRRQRPLSRVLNIVFGVGFFAYGFYLAFLFDGGHYIIFFKAFILPVVLIVRALSSARRNAATSSVPQWQNTSAYPQQPYQAPMQQGYPGPVQQAYPPAMPQWQNAIQQSPAMPQWQSPVPQPNAPLAPEGGGSTR